VTSESAGTFTAPRGSFDVTGRIYHVERRDCWAIQIDSDSPYIEGVSPLIELVGLPQELKRQGERAVLKVHANSSEGCTGGFMLVVESAHET
jgi:hypothetical protein